jgi:hypothetical protein
MTASGVWRAVAREFMAPGIEDGAEEWMPSTEDSPYARTCWRMVDVSLEELWDENGDAHPNPHYDADARRWEL